MTAPHADTPTPMPVAVFFAALWLHFWHYGYGYGGGDQDELIPYLLHRLRPELFTADWFVQAQAAAFTVRDPAVWLLEALAHVMPIWLAFLALYLVVWYAIAHGVFRLTWTFVPNRTAAAASVVLALGVFTLWTLGGNDLVYDRFSPELLGWALALPGFRAFVVGRPIRGGLWLGAATLFHPLVGLLTAFALGLTALVRRRWAHALRFGGTYAVTGLPIVAFFALGQTGVPDATTTELFYITAAFRNPHHYLPFSFGLRSYVFFGLLAGAAVVGYRVAREREATAHAAWLRAFVGVVVGLCVLALVATEGLAMLTVAKLQFFKLTVWLKTLFVVLATGGLWWALPTRWRERIGAVDLDAPAVLAAVLLAWTVTLGLAFNDIGRAGRLIEPIAHAASDLGRAEAWARANTPINAVFAVPPGNDTFRSNAHRAIVINRKAFPFDDALLPEWYARLRAFAPMPLPARGVGVVPRLDAAYHTLTPADWRRLAARYDVAYALIDTTAQATPLPFDVAFSAGRWTIYALPSLDPSAPPDSPIAFRP